jgi:hypothetical protein
LQFGEGDIFQGGISILIHSGRRRLPPSKSYRSKEPIGIGKTNSWMPEMERQICPRDG